MTHTALTTVLSSSALATSLFTLWFMAMRRGTVRSTHPAVIAFRYDFVGAKAPQAKIFIRVLLLSTGKRGRVVESLFLRVREGARVAEFSYWGYVDQGHLVRGSGIFVPETGLATNHHFNPADTENVFLFSEGAYSLELVAKVLGRKRLLSLWRIELEMPLGVFGSNIPRDSVVFFNWLPERRQYVASIVSPGGAMDALFDPQASA
jgi:hypothetical protein